MAIEKRTFENGLKAARTGRRRRRRLMLAAITGLVALAVSACGTGDASTAYAPAAADGRLTVVIEDLEFEPEMLTIEADDTVTWTWKDGAIGHDVSGDGFRSDVMSTGTFRHTFDEAGTYDYVCTLHPNMTGTIEVTK
jgi:plastocyanin